MIVPQEGRGVPLRHDRPGDDPLSHGDLAPGRDAVRRRSSPDAAFPAAFRRRPAVGLRRTWNLQHVSFGTVLGDDGRPFKTRSGDTVGLEGLLDEAVRRALRDRVRRTTTPSPTGRNFRPTQRRAVAETVGIAALEICRPVAEPHQRLRLQLRQDAGHDRQHGHVHAVRLRPGAEHLCQGRRGRRRPCARSGAPIVLGTPAERALGLELLRFAEALDLTVADYRPNQLTAYLFDLANRYSTFFEQCPVLQADTRRAAPKPPAAVRPDGPHDPAGTGTAGDRRGGEDVGIESPLSRRERAG